MAEIEKIAPGVASEFDGFQDNPWPLLFKQMDSLLPGSKFILTIRDEDAWYRSALRHFDDRELPMRAIIYGPEAAAPVGNEAVWRARYAAHNDAVREYFTGRPGDLLTIDLTKGEQWGPLCRFLGQPVPGEPFPHKNPMGTPQKQKPYRVEI